MPGDKKRKICFAEESLFRTIECESEEDTAVIDETVKTHTRDGPSATTLVVEKLFSTVTKQRKLTKPEIRMIVTDGSANEPNLLMEQHVQQVTERLQFVEDKIGLNGKARILPSTMNIGKNYLRFIAFVKPVLNEMLPTETL